MIVKILLIISLFKVARCVLDEIIILMSHPTLTVKELVDVNLMFLGWVALSFVLSVAL